MLFSSMRACGVVFCFLTAIAFTPGAATAFCRTKTCRDTASKKCERDANDCISEGKPVAWRSRCIEYHVHRLGTEHLAVEPSKTTIELAFAAWSDRQCPKDGPATFKFVRGDDVDLDKRDPVYVPGGPNINVVFFRDDDWPYKGIDGTLATTSVNFDKDTGEIYDADIAINSKDTPLTKTDDPLKVSYDLQSIVVHEAGHFLGLNHSEDPTAIMNSTYSKGELNRLLQPDDYAGLCNAYPSDRPAGCTLAAPTSASGCCAVAPNAGPEHPQASNLHTAATSNNHTRTWPVFALLGVAATLVGMRRWRGKPRAVSRSTSRDASNAS